MKTRKPLVIGAVALLVVLLVAGVVFGLRQFVFKPTTITAYFPSATAIYPGDEVRIAGVTVGKIDAIDPQGDQAKLTLRVDHGISVPVDAKVSRFVDSAANALDGNGAKLRETLAQLSGVARVFANGSGNIVDIIKGLQTFVTALRNSSDQIVVFENRLATLSSVVDDSNSSLDAMLKNLSVAIGDVQRFVAGSRKETSEQVQRLANVTQVLAEQKDAIRNILHVTPNAIANTFNMYNPSSGSAVGSFALANFSNPVQVICSMIGAVENTTAPETAKLCSQYMGPALRLLNFNGVPFPISPYLTKAPSPDKLIYADPAMIPGSTNQPQQPAETPPTVSAYTGLNGDVAPPPGWGVPPGPPSAFLPNGAMPANPSPPVYPGAPPPGPTTFDGMLLPAGPPPGPAPGPDPNAPLLPAEGTPPS
jgi:phospholipid/cholesterol/gamma-HCH transport system substrate-binding protein